MEEVSSSRRVDREDSFVHTTQRRTKQVHLRVVRANIPRAAYLPCLNSLAYNHLGIFPKAPVFWSSFQQLLSPRQGRH